MKRYGCMWMTDDSDNSDNDNKKNLCHIFLRFVAISPRRASPTGSGEGCHPLSGWAPRVLGPPTSTLDPTGQRRSIRRLVRWRPRFPFERTSDLEPSPPAPSFAPRSARRPAVREPLPPSTLWT